MTVAQIYSREARNNGDNATMGKLSAVAQQATEYELPEEGQYTAVLCDWIDLGWVEVTHNGESKGLKPKIKPVFQLDEADSNGRRFLVYDFPYVISLDKKANLTKTLTAWLTPSGLQKFLDEDEGELDNLLGRCASVSIVHKQSGEKTYANIGAIMPLGKRMPTIEVEDYTRFQDTDKWAERQPEHSCWGPKPEAEEPPAPVKPARFVPEATEVPERPARLPAAMQARQDAKAVPDKHDFDAAQQRAQAAMAKAKEPAEDDDGEDPFADE